MANFASCIFSASRVQHISDLHSKFALKPHHVWTYSKLDIQSATAENRRGKKKKKKKPQDENIMACPIPYAIRIKYVNNTRLFSQTDQ